MTRSEWKHIYRMHRIVRRESMKVLADAMIFGFGASRMTDDGPRHVPFEEWRKIIKDKPNVG